MVTETINYYLNGNSTVYALFLEASKAFDKVNHTKLFNILMEKGICPIMLRLIINMYKNNNAKVRWNYEHSPTFLMTNGVKQGGVLSPYLFSLYLDPLINKIKNSGFGCHVGKTATNVLLYADDVVLLVPTITSLKRMVDISEEYGKSHKLQFNSIKSEIVILNNNKNIKIEI